MTSSGVRIGKVWLGVHGSSLEESRLKLHSALPETRALKDILNTQYCFHNHKIGTLSENARLIKQLGGTAAISRLIPAAAVPRVSQNGNPRKAKRDEASPRALDVIEWDTELLEKLLKLKDHYGIITDGRVRETIEYAMWLRRTTPGSLSGTIAEVIPLDVSKATTILVHGKGEVAAELEPGFKGSNSGDSTSRSQSAILTGNEQHEAPL